MIFYDVFRLIEPKGGHASKYFSFPGYGIGHDHVKGRNSVRGDNEEAILNLVYVAHLAFAYQF
jgi:hypothetical protein